MGENDKQTEMIDYKQLDSDVCRCLRLPLALMVVFIHSAIGQMTVFDMTQMSLSDYAGINIYTIVCALCSRVLPTVAVPAFFAMSGYWFFFDANDKVTNNRGGYFKEKWNKRIKTLLIPYMVWNLLKIIMILGIECVVIVKNELSFSRLLNVMNEHGWFLGIFWTQPADPPLWFLRDLIGIVIISPILYVILRKIPISALSVMAVACSVGYDVNICCVNLSSVLFFSIGAFLAISRKSITQLCSKTIVKKTSYISVLLAIVTLLVVLIADNGKTLIGSLTINWYRFSALIVIVNIMSWLIIHQCSILSILIKYSSLTFFIYAFHDFIGWQIIKPVLYLLFPIAGMDSVNVEDISLTPIETVLSLLRYFALPLSVFLISIVTCLSCRKMLPTSFYKTLCGGR